ncbi:hypothetical protein PtA15_8A612 [Puccinia triticina]|uniref:Uncharacterized protein n=1 Tax=Puccinia triticina TaxID=208348 RepID=A0ABY7CR07_9BASI|nr:uncharacterized protein PtA15_8A612 [Puccinia triticina]WAQ87706.1 hypothetical protein PtA15_8A612 [Puccinia triticina]WAR57587.1 hypothetical protein PtB15_8B639 [Puccinia triticina]
MNQPTPDIPPAPRLRTTADIQPSPRLRTTAEPPAIPTPPIPADRPAPDTHDSARVNRKILDLEISNASLLAINGALERTKAKQQAELRALKARLPLAVADPGPASASADDDEEEESLESLGANDPRFAELVLNPLEIEQRRLKAPSD